LAREIGCQAFQQIPVSLRVNLVNHEKVELPAVLALNVAARNDLHEAIPVFALDRLLLDCEHVEQNWVCPYQFFEEVQILVGLSLIECDNRPS